MQKIMGCEVVEMKMLKGMDIAIKQGDKLFVWPGFQFLSEFKYLEVPTGEEWEKQLREQHDKELKGQLFSVPDTASIRIDYFFDSMLLKGFPYR